MRSFLKKIDVIQYEQPLSLNELPRKIYSLKEKPSQFKIKDHVVPIVSGLIHSREMIARALDINKNEIIPFILEKLENIKSYDFTRDAVFLAHEIKLDSSNDVEQYLPLIDFYGNRKYITSSIVIVNYPGEERLNASFHRMMYLGNNRFSIRIVAQRHLDNAYQEALQEGKDLNVAVIFSVHPAVELAAAFSAPHLDELKLATAFLGNLTLYTLSNGISVPSEAEFVLMGKITNETAEEGPFIDLTGTVDQVRQQPVFQTDVLYYRDNPLFRTILPGGNEHKMLMGIPQEPRIYKIVSNAIPTVKDVVLTTGGNCWLHAVVQIIKRTEGDGKNAILAALAAHPSLKRVIIVDEDVDLTNPEEVEWAVASRVQPDKDILIIPNAKGSSLDPSAKDSITSKWGIDATKPLKNNEGFLRVRF
ncbi:MAG: UbiD family decarboxylase [Promethearchaeota archaeon]